MIALGIAVAVVSAVAGAFAVAAYGRDDRLTLRRYRDDLLPHAILREETQSCQ